MAQFVSETPVSSHGFEYGVKHFINPKSGSISEIVRNVLNLEDSQIQDLLHLGAIYVDNVRQTQDAALAENKLFRVHTKPRRHKTEYSWKQLIVFECTDFLVLNKPAGIPSHAAVDNRIDNSLYQLSQILGLNLSITHRLDTMTEGLIVYSKTDRFVQQFNQLIQNRQVQKKYVALVETTETLPRKLIHYMEASPRAPKKVTAYFQEKSALCELEIESQKIESDRSWVKINLLTGRTHQIRAQLSASNAPLVGDQLYGAKQTWPHNGIALRACELEFTWNDRIYPFKLPEEFNN